jgi:hypothetical protein
MKVSDVNACQLHVWYDRFKRHTIKTKCIPLSGRFAAFLRSDGIQLPRGFNSSRYGDHIEYDEEVEVEEEEDDWDDLVCELECIGCALEELGGAVLPKLNWSAPKDATWINAGETMRCTRVSEIIILLKASDFISHDLNCPYEYCQDLQEQDQEYQLVLNLRKWSQLYPSREFRCFVKNRHIVGICQRDIKTHYSHLHEPECKKAIETSIAEFYQHVLRDQLELSDCVCDVYVDQDYCSWLLDVNVYGLPTDSLLYSWEELDADVESGLRLLSEEQGGASVLGGLVQRLPLDMYAHESELLINM